MWIYRSIDKGLVNIWFKPDVSLLRGPRALTCNGLHKTSHDTCGIFCLLQVLRSRGSIFVLDFGPERLKFLSPTKAHHWNE